MNQFQVFFSIYFPYRSVYHLSFTIIYNSTRTLWTSGLAMKHSIHVGAGIIDPDYTGEIKILLLNLGTEP